ncbi:MAG: alpha/beta hydrolase [Williamsia sp.]|nr:alpha/beta hydrolase [Williamsia sp.]
MKKLLLAAICLQMSLTVISQEIIPLYSSVPNSKPGPDEEKMDTAANGRIGGSKVSRPTLTVFVPEAGKANGTAVVICPGGGYVHLAMTHEGYDVAKRLNSSGITCFVLKYRLPSDQIMVKKEIGPLQDAQRAIQIVREGADRWHLNKNKIGIIGFSAGGHLASTAGTHFQQVVIDNKAGTSLRPDFMILGYPVISFSDSLAHMGSRNNLVGKEASPELVNLYSNELQVTTQTPPTFLVHAKDDRTVKVENSLRFKEKLDSFHVPAEIYLYEKGGHGFGLNNSTSDVKWMDLAEAWLRKQGFL